MKENKKFLLNVFIANVITMIVMPSLLLFLNFNNIISNIVICILSIVFFFYIGFKKCRNLSKRFFKSFCLVEFFISCLLFVLSFINGSFLTFALLISQLLYGMMMPLTNLLLPIFGNQVYLAFFFYFIFPTLLMGLFSLFRDKSKDNSFLSYDDAERKNDL